MNIEVKNKFENYLKLREDIIKLFNEYYEFENKEGKLFVFVGNPISENLRPVSRFIKCDDLCSSLADYLFKRSMSISEFRIMKLNENEIRFDFGKDTAMFKIEFND